MPALNFPDAPVNGQIFTSGGMSWQWDTVKWGQVGSGMAPPPPSLILPSMDGVAQAGVGIAYTREDHIHPTDTSRYAASNPSGYISGNQGIVLSGDVTGSGSTAITATLQTVNPTVGTYQGITVNGKGLVTGASDMGYAPLQSPHFSGTPLAPVAPLADNSTQLATTAWVKSQGYGTGSGGITGITAGTGLTGGGTSGNVTVALGTPVPVSLGGTGGTTAASGLANLGGVSSASPTFTGTATFAGLTANGTTNLNGTNNIQGVTNGSAAAAGDVGEVISITQAVTIGYGTTNSVNAITSFVLPPGDWDVSGEVWIAATGITSFGQFVGGWNTTTAFNTSPSLAAAHERVVGANANPDTQIIACATGRLNVSSNTSVYLLGQCAYTGGSISMGGVLWARRRR